MSRWLPLYVFLALLTGGLVRPAAAQEVFWGTVVDAVTGEGLPGASLQIEGTYSGTITSASGGFELRTEERAPVLIVRFIGYEPQRITVSDPDQPVRIALRASAITLPEITITGEDPAVRIMRRVIEEKQRWRAALNSYSVEAYNRFRMENDTGIVSIWESSTRAFWDRERGVREIALWQQQTRNMQLDNFMPAALFVVNLYDDDIEVAGHRLMGVTHPDALDAYRFRLQSIESQGQQDVFVIAVEPRRDTFAGFRGVIRVQDEDFALLSVELEPGEAFLFPPPIQYVTVAYRQQFSAFGGDFWLPVDLQTEMDLKVGVVRMLDFPPFRIRQTSRLSDFAINVPVPDSLYEGRERLVVDSTLVRMDARPPELSAVPLSEQEARAYATIDSTLTMEKAFEPSGAFARFVKNDVNGSGEGGGGTGSVGGSVGRVRLGVVPDVQYNRVAEWHLGAKPRVTLVRYVDLIGRVAWETGPQRVSGAAGFRLGNRYRLQALAADETAVQIESAVKEALINSGSVLLGEADYFDYYRRRGITVEVSGRRVTPARLAVTARLGLDEHSSLNQQIRTSALGRDLEDRFNPGVDEGSLTYLRLEASREWDSLPVPIGPQKKITVRSEWSLGGDIGKRTPYGRYEVDVFWRFPTFFQRRMIPNALDVRFVAGLATSKAPSQRWGAVDGATILSTFGSLKTAEHPPYAGNQWVLLAWEHAFRTLPFEWLDWDWALRRHWNVLIHGASGWSRFQGVDAGRLARTGAVAAPDGHHEVGLSLSGLFTVLRVDTAWRLDAPGFRVGASIARVF
jgi:hypothetical protein